MMYDLAKEDYILLAEAFDIPIAFGKQSGVCYRMDKVADRHSEQEYEEFHPYWDNSLLYRMFEDMVKGCPATLTNLILTYKYWDDTFNATILRTWLNWKKSNVA